MRKEVSKIIDVYEKGVKNSHTELALVKMQPGTRYENFFRDMVTKKNRINDSLGIVSINWLFKLEKRKE
mgnify:FL=1